MSKFRKPSPKTTEEREKAIEAFANAGMTEQAEISESAKISKSAKKSKATVVKTKAKKTTKQQKEKTTKGKPGRPKKVKADKKNLKFLQLRLSSEWISQIDTILEKRNKVNEFVEMSRHSWILQAIKEKMEKEN